MATARIKTASGAHIIIEGDSSEVAKIISQLDNIPRIVEAKRRASVHHEVKKNEKRKNTVTDQVVLLKEDGFFDKPKGLADVSKKLEEGGWLCPVTTLSGVMLALVKKRQLSRIKRDGGWMYGKR